MQRIGSSFLLLILFFSFGPSPTQAQSIPPTTGVVRDSSGAAIARPTVVIRQETGGLERVVTADAAGAFTLPPLAPGKYDVTVSAPGFAAVTQSLAVPQSVALSFTLTPAPVLEEVTVVSASRQQELRDTLNTRVDVVTRSRIEEGGGHETVGELLRELPGVVTRRGSETAGPASEQIQGIDSRQVLVLLDGQPIAGARGIKRGGVLNLDRQSSARLERVEVVKGAASTLYGSEAIGGVINLITRAPAAPLETSLSVTGGNFGIVGSRIDAGFKRGATFGLFSGERHQHDGFDLTPATFDTTGSPYRRYDGLAKVQRQMGNAFDLGGVFTGYRNETGGRSNGELGPQEDDIEDHALSGNVTARWFRAGTGLEGRGYVSHFKETANAMLAPPRSKPAPPASLEERFQKVDVTLTQTIGPRQLLQAGMEWARDHYDGVNRLRNEDTGHEADRLVAWAQHRWNPANWLTTTVGARVDRRYQYETAVSPKVAANARISENLRARISYGRGFRAPDLGQLYYRFLSPSNFYQVIGNPSLAPEHANSWQAGADYTMWGRRARLGVNAFRNDVSDLIESVSVGFAATPAQLAALLEREGLDPSFKPALGRPLLTYRNISDVTTQGVELDGEAAVTKALSVGGAYTYLSARDADTDRDLTGRHRHHGHARVSWTPNSGFRASLRGTFFSSWIAARATVPGGGVKDTVAPRFAVWDAFFSQRLPRGLSAFFNLENIGDSQDPNTGVMLPNGTAAAIYRPDAGRSVRVGLQWAFAAR